MSVINSNALLAAAGGDYQISRSVRLRSSASGYFNRTPASSGNRKTWTWSGWIKRGKLCVSEGQTLFRSPASDPSTGFRFTHTANGDTSNDCLRLFFNNAASGDFQTAQVFRDVSAWYHLIIAVDTTQATSANRVKIYINGIQITSFTTATYPTQNYDTQINAAVIHGLGTYNGTAECFDGYLTEVNFIDGQALTPSSFGETDAVTGVWKPKKYAGTYGTNGFYLNFSDNSAATAAAIGKDSSGNGNNWTPNNISVTSGVTYDSMLDTPTPYADGGNGRGNYAVVNPLFRNASMLSDGNLYFNKSTIGWATGQATMPLPSQKTYFEATATLIGGANSGVFIGIATAASAQDTYQVANQWSFGGTGGTLKLYNQTALVTPSGSSAAGDIFQVAYDGATGNLWFGKNNTWYDSAGGTTGNPSTGSNATMTLTAGTEVFPCAICYANGLKFTFGQQPFSYTPPTGFKALNTQNLPDSPIKKGNQYFDATLYTGNSSTQTIVNAGGFQPDLVWAKDRTNAYSGAIFDSVRGAGNGKELLPNLTSAEGANSGTSNLTSFNSNGFSLGTTSSTNAINYTGDATVAWQWKESATAGFDIVTYTGTGANRTVAHSLGVAPKMLIVKSRNGTAKSWNVWHAAFAATDFLYLEQTAAKATDATKWNSTAPSSSVFSLGSAGGTNASGENFVAYLFSEVAGFSKFGSYTGNGSSDGPFVYCGFRPRWIMVKSAGSITDWFVWDTARSQYNLMQEWLRPDTSAAEGVTTAHAIDVTANGFKFRGTDTGVNASGVSFIFAAFAENPFKNSLAR